MSKIKEFLKWFEQFVTLPAKLRKQQYQFVMDDLKKSACKGHRELYEMLKSSRFVLVGMCPNVQYAIFDGAKEYMDARWVHPLGFHSMLVYDKRMMCFMIVGAKIRFNDSVVNELLRQSQKVELHDELILTKKNIIPTEGATG